MEHFKNLNEFQHLKIKIYPKSLAIRETQIKTMRHHFTPSRMTIIQKTVVSVSKEMEKLELHALLMRMNTCFGKQLSGYSKY